MMGLSTKKVSSTDGSEWSQSALLLQPPPPPQQQILHPTTTTKPPPPRDPTSRSRNQTNQLGNNQPEPLKCPRCDSGNTKFCYYNNYNKSQPRHFCKSCKRHWTNGGTLRNVPVGGGRKNKRPSHSKPSAAGRIINKVIQAQQSKKPKQSRGSSSNDVVLFNHPTLPPSPIAPPAESDSVAEFDDDEAGGVGFVFTQAMSFPNYSAPSSAAAFDGEFLGLPPTWQVPSTIVGGSGDVSDITAGAAETAATATGGGYWNWDVDMDTLVSSADLNIPWDDDSEIKP